VLRGTRQATRGCVASDHTRLSFLSSSFHEKHGHDYTLYLFLYTRVFLV
jgi:hypothetical protein